MSRGAPAAVIMPAAGGRAHALLPQAGNILRLLKSYGPEARPRMQLAADGGVQYAVLSFVGWLTASGHPYRLPVTRQAPPSS